MAVEVNGENMKLIGIYNVDNYADDGGGIQDPMPLKSTNIKDAQEEAIEFIKKSGYKDGNKKTGKYLVDKFTIFVVNQEIEIDVEQLNIYLAKENKDEEEARRKSDKVKTLKKLITELPEEAKQLVKENEK